LKTKIQIYLFFKNPISVLGPWNMMALFVGNLKVEIKGFVGIFLGKILELNSRVARSHISR
jgi:hypothetical protein